MKLDIRYPIGFLFLVIGALLVAYGALAGPGVNDARSLGIDINLWWGFVQVAFGGIMVALAWFGSKKASKP